MISVCMATYNGERFIQKQVQSILSQLNNIDELIVVDDFSVDNTVKLMKKFKDTRVKIINNSRNMGSISSFNKALSLANGEYVFLADQDDVWYKTKVVVSISQLEKENLDLIIHDARVIDVNKGHIISESLFKLYKSSPGLIRNLISSRHTGCCMVLRNSALKNLLPIPTPLDEKGFVADLLTIKGIQHDTWLGVLSSIYGLKKKFVNIPLIDYQRHINNESPLKRQRHFLSAFIDRIILILCLFLRVAGGGYKYMNWYHENK